MLKPPTSGVFAIMLFVAAMFNETENDDLTETFGPFWALAEEAKSRMMTTVNNRGISQNRVG